jgi:CHAT domain-containing protein/Tfp pilus assembly protein PilF
MRARLKPLILVLACTLRAAAQAPPEGQGVVIEDLPSGSALSQAGLLAGDVVVAWERLPSPPANPEGARGDLRTVFEWQWTLKVEVAPRGKMRLTAWRGGERRVFDVLPGRWDSHARPALPAALAERWTRGIALLGQGKLDEGVALAQGVAAELRGAGDRERAAEVGFLLGDRLNDKREWKRATEILQAAVADAEDPTARAILWRWIGGDAMRSGDFAGAIHGFEEEAKLFAERAEVRLLFAVSQWDLGFALSSKGDFQGALERYRSAVALQETEAPGSSNHALALYDLGRVEMRLEKLDDAETHLGAAAAIQEKPGGDPVGLARTLGTRGWVLGQRGRYAAARADLERAVGLLKETAPRSQEAAMAISNLGFIAVQQGDLDGAERSFRAAVDLVREIAPGSANYATAVGSLAAVERQRGLVAQAEEGYRTALAVWSKLGGERADMGVTLVNLGNIARERGDLDLAAERFERARQIFEKVGVRGPSLAETLQSLGDLALFRGDVATAEAQLKRALAIFDAVAPDNVGRPLALAGLGQVAMARGDLKTARTDLEAALAGLAKGSKASLYEAQCRLVLGDLEARAGRLAAARQEYRQALALYSAKAPGTAEEAGVLLALAGLARRRGRGSEAVALYQRAVDTLAAQRLRLGGAADVGGTFFALHQNDLRDFVDLLVERQDAERAFAVLERFRARGLLDLLAARDVASDAALPAPLLAARRQLEADYDRLQSQLAELDAGKEAGRAAEIRAKLREARDQYEGVVAEIRKASPAFAALRYPQPVDAQGARAALDPGTVLLSYSVGRKRTQLFIVTPAGPLAVRTLPVGEEALRRDVERFRALVVTAEPGTAVGRQRLAALSALGRRLYAALLAPAERQIGRAERLLLVADGPLHTLPWGALSKGPNGPKGSTGSSGVGAPGGPGAAASRPRYLIERLPLHFALSATVYSELERRAAPAPHPDAPTLAAFADPAIPQALRAEHGATAAPAAIAAGDVRLRAAAERGLALEPLPGSRDEAQRIAQLFPARAEVRLGADATEESAKTAGARARYLHFATHVSLDERLPLNSAVVLSLPERFEEGKDNGLLQAWEIFDSLRLDADLVVLSGCESGLGRELGGEGLQGLTRAFLYAGARSVAASLWKVGDRATAELMVRFYRHLGAGESKDAALRNAQIDLIRSGREGGPADLARPFSWAAFQLYGDWR